MFLNANTATRRFRELQFDLCAVLQAFMDIRPIDGPSDFLYVEIRWADGSTDVVPVFDFIRELSECYEPSLDKVCHLSDTLTIAGAQLIPGNADAASPYYQDSVSAWLVHAGLSANVSEVTSTAAMVISDSHIFVMKASSITLPEWAPVKALDTRDVSSNISHVRLTHVSNKAVIQDCVVQELDVHRFRLSGAIQYPASRLDASRIDNMASVAGATRSSGFELSGPLRLTSVYSGQVQDAVTANRATVTVEVPVKISGGYQYVGSEATYVPANMTDYFEYGSLPWLVMMYPFVTVQGYSSFKNIKLRLGIPKSTDDGKIVQVSNTNVLGLRVCNAWSLNMSDNVGKVEALNYMTLPSYSTIDFLVRFDMGAGDIKVYMLPMVYGDLHG